MNAPFKDVVLEGLPAGPLAARVYKPEGLPPSPPLVLYLHGGAFTDTVVKMDRPVAASFAKAGAVVVVADYGSASKHAFPQVLESAFGLLEYLDRKRAKVGNRNSPLFVAGEESGGNLAAGVALKARDLMPGKLDGQILISPLLDPFMGSKSFELAEGIGMRERWSDGWNRYLASLGGICHPYAAPKLCSRLAGLAPALLLTAQDDPLRDETLEYGRLLEKAGVRTTQNTLPSGAGWVDIYGGQTNDEPTWQEPTTRSFTEFLHFHGSNPPEHAKSVYREIAPY